MNMFQTWIRKPKGLRKRIQYDFADKTLFIKEIFNSSYKNMLITAPSNFSKSNNLEMLMKFVEIPVLFRREIIENVNDSPNHYFFEQRKFQIYQDEEFFKEHFGKYPVIYVDLKLVHVNGSRNTFAAVVDTLRWHLHSTFNKHEYLLESTKLNAEEINQFKKYCNHNLFKILSKLDIIRGLVFLAECLYKHFDGRKVFLLIDDYDNPINVVLFSENCSIYYVIKLYSQMLTDILNSEYVEKAVLTGANYFASVVLSNVNNIGTFKFLDNHPFMQYHSLTEFELDQVFDSLQVDCQAINNYKNYYNGHEDLKMIKSFSISSILRFLENDNEVHEHNWLGSPHFLIYESSTILTIPIIRYAIEKLCLSKFLVIEVLDKMEMEHIIELRKLFLEYSDPELIQLQKPDLYLNYMLHKGYLTYERVRTDNFRNVQLLNFSIKEEFQQQLNEYYESKYVKRKYSSNSWDISCTYGPSLLHAHLNHCAMLFNKITPNAGNRVYEDFLIQFSEILNKICFQSENGYHNLMFNILCKTNFFIGDEGLTFTDGKPDLIFCKKDLGIVMQVEYAKSPAIALQKILDNHVNVFYEKFCFRYVTNVIYLGLNINRNNTAIIYVLVNSTNLNDAYYFKTFRLINK